MLSTTIRGLCEENPDTSELQIDFPINDNAFEAIALYIQSGQISVSDKSDATLVELLRVSDFLGTEDLLCFLIKYIAKRVSLESGLKKFQITHKTVPYLLFKRITERIENSNSLLSAWTTYTEGYTNGNNSVPDEWRDELLSIDLSNVEYPVLQEAFVQMPRHVFAQMSPCGLFIKQTKAIQALIINSSEQSLAETIYKTLY